MISFRVDFIKESERLIAPSEPELDSSLDEPQDEEALDRFILLLHHIYSIIISFCTSYIM